MAESDSGAPAEGVGGESDGTRDTEDSTQQSPAERRHLAVRTLDREGQNRNLEVDGEIPGWIGGSLIRTGPA
jgi:hypothetical protein